MNIADIFSNRRLLDTALALSVEPAARVDETRMARAGVHADARPAVASAVGVLRELREGKHCAECTDSEACLDANTLAEFVDGVLPESERAGVERRLAHCEGCLHQALELASLTAELAPQPRWHETVVAVAKRSLKVVAAPQDGFALSSESVPQLMNTAQAEALRWTATQDEVAVTFSLVLEEEERATLMVEIDRLPEHCGPVRIAMRQDDRLIEAAPADAGKPTVFTGLPRGSYVVELESAYAPPATFDLTLSEEVSA